MKQSGYCTICDDLIEELKRQYESKEKKRTFQRVELDFKLPKETHEKLVEGSLVDPQVVNTLLLGGINNILYQSDLIEETAEKVKTLEIEVLTNKARMETLENWVVKLSEKYDEVKRKLEMLDNNNAMNMQ